MKEFALENYGMEELSESEMKEVNGGFIRLAMRLVFRLLLAAIRR